VLGAGVLTLIAGRGLLALRRPAAAVPADLGGTERRPLACLGRFVALTAINPMTAIYFTVLAAGLSATSGLDLTRPAQATAFVAGIGLGSLSWQVVLATIGAVAGIRLSPSVRTGIGAVGYAIVLGYAVLLLVT
jgi:arginine exporter protein ArgO